MRNPNSLQIQLVRQKLKMIPWLVNTEDGIIQNEEAAELLAELKAIDEDYITIYAERKPDERY